MKKFLIVIGGILLATSLAFNIHISLNQTESSSVSILTTQNKALANGEGTNDGFISINTDCTYWWWAQDPFSGEWHYYKSPGHITEYWIDWLHLWCDAHDCIWNI